MNQGQFKHSFSVTLDDKLQDLVLKHCQENNMDKTCFFRTLLADKFGLADQKYQIKRAPRTGKKRENNS